MREIDRVAPIASRSLGCQPGAGSTQLDRLPCGSVSMTTTGDKPWLTAAQQDARSLAGRSGASGLDSPMVGNVTRFRTTAGPATAFRFRGGG